MTIALRSSDNVWPYEETATRGATRSASIVSRPAMSRIDPAEASQLKVKLVDDTWLPVGVRTSSPGQRNFAVVASSAALIGGICWTENSTMMIT